MGELPVEVDGWTGGRPGGDRSPACHGVVSTEEGDAVFREEKDCRDGMAQDGGTGAGVDRGTAEDDVRVEPKDGRGCDGTVTSCPGGGKEERRKEAGEGK